MAINRAAHVIVLFGGCSLMASAALAQLGAPSAEDLSLQQRRMPFSMAPPPLVADPRNLAGFWKINLGRPPERGSPAPVGGGPRGALPPGVAGRQSGPAWEAYQRRRLECLPDFAPWSSTEGAPTQIVQTSEMVMLLFEEYHKVRKIHLDSEHPAGLSPSYAGDSVGHWEGDTLMVDTTAIKGAVEVGGPDASPTLHLRERIRKIDGGAVLEDVMSYHDTAGGKVPDDQRVTLNWVGGPRIMEWICEDSGATDLESRAGEKP